MSRRLFWRKIIIMRPKAVLDLFKVSIIAWFWSDAALYAAALAYYTIFSLAPLLIISMVIATQLFSQAAVEGRIVTTIDNVIGSAGAIVVQDIIKNSQGFLSSSVATGISLVFLLYGASSVFRELRRSLNAMWGIAARGESLHQSLITMVKTHLLSAAAVLTVGFFVLGALLLNALWAALPATYFETVMQYVAKVVPMARLIASPIIYVIIFALIFKTLPQASIRWRDVWFGAGVTAVLFWLGGYTVGLYLSYSVWASIYGAAGSLIAFLLWVYYCTWIFLFGAKFTLLYAAKFGKPIVPHADAMFIITGYTSEIHK
ncbi:MAG: YihY/virulence factor BrkB family protein [Anaerolineae bacterium]|nr:YihY/virulence factor BrkB family protein [Anaerolineae bacterium]